MAIYWRNSPSVMLKRSMQLFINGEAMTWIDIYGVYAYLKSWNETLVKPMTMSYTMSVEGLWQFVKDLLKKGINVL